MRPILKVPLKYGAIGSALAIILVVTLFYMDRHPLLIPIIVDFRLFLIPLFVILSIREFRDFFNHRLLHFWQGMAVGFLTYAAIGLFTGAAILLFAGWIETEFLTTYIDISMQQLKDNKELFLEKVGEESYRHNLERLPLTQPIHLAADYFLKTILIGILYTIIISVFLRRQPKP